MNMFVLGFYEECWEQRDWAKILLKSTGTFYSLLYRVLIFLKRVHTAASTTAGAHTQVIYGAITDCSVMWVGFNVSRPCKSCDYFSVCVCMP